MYGVLLSKIRVLIIGADELIREGLCFLMSRLMPNATILVAGCEERIEGHPAEISLILYLLGPPYLTGIEQIYALRARYPGAAMLALGNSELDGVVSIAAASRINGFLLVSDEVESLQAAIVDVLAGKPVFPDGSMASTRPLHLPRLTPRQMEVYNFMCTGKTNKEIGALLNLSDNTIRSHVSAILKELRVATRTEATRLERLFLRD